MQRWASRSEGLAIPQGILDGVTESPWGFSTALFTARADDALSIRADTPSDELARVVVEDGTRILDVGSGAGAAGLRFIDHLVEFTAVDTDEELLDQYAFRARQAGRPLKRIRAVWPTEVEQHDLVLCHHVAYNVSDVGPFVQALVDAASSLVVIELTAQHPLDWLRPYWRALHGWDAPAGPDADLFEEVLVELGITAERTDWTRLYEPMISGVDGLRRRLCLPEDREGEIRLLLDARALPSLQDVVTFTISR